ncbi:conserved Plasmodium protein, unknown function [Plasmodium knowlesi strain H]|uniref:Uncharacterized protein n=2 Tax=Plasmodium knowlesi TaxID=5850 RepID=B3L1F1_PLAKH|nr:conserved Plasmodium protein, unknown function [Plasmodium knowlesi strain H]OTN67903.1 Uncharacterized protein PKNOH_S04357300 [Plasmodium knowlesi]CAA9986936.1 conserved Plasmodium protein, unknown function [Plasmodium knowlesi strain H]VVS76410.1 conserved Plasmodium protein, unknown function [Plasmodium knowlesi strain H]|eukprot:XP_002258183.1 hypothetical protein, conserved in Plasmodium species [Plasmodium knowlesi strain H]
MAEKKIDESPFLHKMENFEIADGKNKKGTRGEMKNVYRSLGNEFNFENEEMTPEVDPEKGPEMDQEGEKCAGVNQSGVNEPGVNQSGVNEPGVNQPGVKEPDVRRMGKSDANIRTIKIDRKNLKKLFSSQFFTQTLTDDSSTNLISELKMSKRYATGEFFKALFLFTLFLTTSYFAFFYIYKNYFGQNHLCGNLDLYNYKYENQVRFIPNVSGAGYYVFTGKFPFDVITHKVRKEVLKQSMNEELDKYKENGGKEPFDKIENLDDHPIQIMSFVKHNNTMKCEKKIFDMYRPFYLKSTDVDITQKNFILSEVNYSFVTNPYNVPQAKLYAEVANFMKKSEAKNKICYMTWYLNSLREDKGVNGVIQGADVGRILSEGNATTSKSEQTTEKETPSGDVTNNATGIITAAFEGAKKYFKGTPTGEEQVPQKKANDLGVGGYFGGMVQPPKRKIVYLYDYYDNNFVDLLVAIHNMQYGNGFRDLKTYWEDLKRKFRVVSPEEIYLLEWYCLGVNYNLIENNNQFKLNCVDLLK